MCRLLTLNHYHVIINLQLYIVIFKIQFFLMEININNLWKYLSYTLLPLSAIYLYNSIGVNSNENNILYNYSSPDVTSFNLMINDNFLSLVDDKKELSSIPNADTFFENLGLKVVGIISVNDKSDEGFVMLESENEKRETGLFRPGDIILENVVLHKISKGNIQLRYNNELYKLSLADNSVVTQATGVIVLDVSLIEVLPYLKAEQGTMNNINGVFINDLVDGKVLEKLNLEKNDFLFNLSGHNVFNLATLNDAYIKLQGRKDIVASLFRNGKLQKFVVRRLEE